VVVVRVRFLTNLPNIGASHSGDCSALQKHRGNSVEGSSPSAPTSQKIIYLSYQKAMPIDSDEVLI
jgi:hypothetical protein